jgi:hypothetical protein
VHCAALTFYNLAAGQFGTAPWDASRPGESVDVLFGNHIPMGFSRARVHVLLSLDTAHTDLTDLPEWRSFGKGRSFYTALRHREDIWTNDPVFRGAHPGRDPLGARTGGLTRG